MMTYEEEVRWLRRYQDSLRREQELAEEVEQLRSRACKVTPSLSGMPGGTSDGQALPRAVEQILEAGTYAPTAMGRQSPILVVVQDPETIQQLSKMNAAVMGADGDPFYGAPTVVIVLADRTIPTYVEDGSLVMGNLMNAAFSLGVNSCWINRAREVFDTEEGKALLKKWGIQGDYAGIGKLERDRSRGIRLQFVPHLEG